MKALTARALAFSLGLLACACAGLGTDVKIPETKPPASFHGQAPGRSSASIDWRTYFGDPPLNNLIHGALSANPDVHIALQRIQIARAGVRQSTGAMLPQVSAVGGMSVQKFGRYTGEGAGNATTDIMPGRPVPSPLGDFGLGLEATWELDAWGKLRSQRSSALAQYLATIEGTRLVVTSLVADVALAYFELVALDHTRDVLAETVGRQEQALEIVRLQKEAGRANELAVQQFAAQLASTKALSVQTAFAMRELENKVNVLRGQYPRAVARSKEVLLRPVPNNISAGVPADLLRNRPDIREAELIVRASKFDLEAARAAFFPTLSVSTGVGLQAFNPKYLFRLPESLVYSASLGLVAPLVNRTAIEAQFAAAKASQIQALYNYQKAVLNAYVEVANGLAGLLANANVVELKRTQKAAVEQTVDTADALYRAGKATYVEVLIAQQNSLSADLELIEARKRQHTTSVLVYKALGGGWR